MEQKIKYPIKPKKGDILICIYDDSEDEDFGMSGIVLKGRRDLQVGKEYEIGSVPWDADRNVPKNQWKTWTKTEFPKIRWGWYQVYLKGVGSPVFLHNFEPKQ